MNDATKKTLAKVGARANGTDPDDATVCAAVDAALKRYFQGVAVEGMEVQITRTRIKHYGNGFDVVPGRVLFREAEGLPAK